MKFKKTKIVIKKTSKKEELVKILLQKAPGLFEKLPRSSMSRSETEKLAEEILK